jgi:hypothetical protein
MTLLAVGVAMGQEDKSAAPASKGERERTVPSSARTPEASPDLRRVQLRMLRESTLSRAAESVKEMDDAALRISVRNQILMHLGDRKLSEEDDSLTARMASDALTDFSEHGEDVPPFMADYLFNDLGAWIQKHQPKLAERLQAVEKNRKSEKEADRIRALLQMKGGDAFAAQHIRQLLAEGQEVDGIFFYLDALKRTNSKEFEPLLAQILEIAERGPQVSFETLFWVSDIYLRPDLSLTLKRRFVATVISRTQPADFVAEPAPQIAYDLLNKVLPFVQELLPELYDRAVAQSVNLRASFTERQLAAEARSRRISESPDPFADLLDEAEAAPSKAERNQLLADAARLALERKRFALCLEVVAKLDRDGSGAPPSFWRNWTDQFLKEFVKTALADKDAEQAEEGAGRIAAPLARVESLALLVRFWVKANDRNAARRILAEAAKTADKASDNLERAKAFLLLGIVSDAADESAKAGLLETAVKALNGVSRPNRDTSNKKPYQQYLRSLDNTGYQLIRAFGDLTKRDEVGALALCEGLRHSDLRAYALVGILQGLDAALAVTK